MVTITWFLDITRLTRGAWPALPIFTEHVTARGSGIHLDIGAGPTHHPGLSLATPSPSPDRMRGDGPEGGGRTRMRKHTRIQCHPGAFVYAAANSITTLLWASEHAYGTTIPSCASHNYGGGLLQPQTVANRSTPKPRVRVGCPVSNFRPAHSTLRKCIPSRR